MIPPSRNDAKQELAVMSTNRPRRYACPVHCWATSRMSTAGQFSVTGVEDGAPERVDGAG